MKILAVDTSSKICSVAILEDENVVDEISLEDEKTHSEKLMPQIAEILSKNAWKLADLDLLACAVGPGSFTGIRIGTASIKAIAEVQRLPIAAVSSLETLARMDTSAKTKIVLIDARNNQVYGGIFDEHYQPIGDFFAEAIEDAIGKLKNFPDSVCIGDGAVLHKHALLENVPAATFLDKNKQNAGFLGKMAYQKYLDNNLQTADTLVPLYLRKSQAERMREK